MGKSPNLEVEIIFRNARLELQGKEAFIEDGVSLRMGMVMFAASLSTAMDSTTVLPAPKAPAALLWRRPKAASIPVDREAANVTITILNDPPSSMKATF